MPSKHYSPDHDEDPATCHDPERRKSRPEWCCNNEHSASETGKCRSSCPARRRASGAFDFALSGESAKEARPRLDEDPDASIDFAEFAQDFL